MDWKEGGILHLAQPHLIKGILNDLRLADPGMATKTTQAAITIPLWTFERVDGPFDNHFHFRSVIRKLNYLKKSTRTNISYATYPYV